jgi:hypothetical protein
MPFRLFAVPLWIETAFAAFEVEARKAARP